MTFTRRKYNRKFRGGKKKTIRRKRKTRRGTRGARTYTGGKRRKSKRRKRKTKRKRRKRRRRQRGGYKCDYPSNVGEIFTGIKLNKNPYLPDPINSNSNIKQRQKGGGFMDNFGMGDALLGWYKGTNAVSNVPIRYKGGKNLMNANPMHQPGLLKEEPIHKTANIPKFYNVASDTAVKNTIS